MPDDLEFRIAKLELRPGDMLVVQFASRLSQEMVARVGDHFTKAIPGVKVLVIDSSCDLTVLSFEEIERRAKLSEAS